MLFRSPIANKTDFIYRSGGSVASSAVKRLVDRILVSDMKARERLKYLWSDARVNRHYNPTYYCKLVDRYAEQLAQSQELNFKRWNILGDYVHMNPAVSGSYEGEVQRVKDYLNERFAQLDRIIGTVEVEVTNPDIDQEELEDDGTGAVEQVKTSNRCRVAVDGACVRFIDTEGD